MKIGDRIREEREGARLSRSALSAQCGIPARTIEAYERDEAAPPWENVVAIAAALRVSLDRMAGRPPGDVPPEAVAALHALEAAQQGTNRALADLALALGDRRRPPPTRDVG